MAVGVDIEIRSRGASALISDMRNIENEMRNLNNSTPGSLSDSIVNQNSLPSMVNSNANSINNQLIQRNNRDLINSNQLIANELHRGITSIVKFLADRERKNEAYRQQAMANSGLTNDDMYMVKNNLTKGFAKVQSVAALGSAAEQLIISGRRVKTMQMAGDVFGAEMEKIQGRQGAVNNVASFLPGLMGTLGALIPGVGPLIGLMVGEGTKGIINAIAGIIGGEAKSQLQNAQERSNLYEGSLKTREGLVAAFGNRSGNVRQQGYDLYSQMLAVAKGTGLDIDEAGQYVAAQKKYGLSLNTSKNNVRNAALWAQATNGDINQYLDYVGKASRFDAGADLTYVNKAAKAGGMNDARMGEFLSGLQSVMENGIARGFVKSTKEVADTLTMLSVLSGNNELWKGQEGANRLNSLNNGLAGATSLRNTSSIIAYQSFRNLVDPTSSNYNSDAGFLNVFAAMEKGLDTKSFYTLKDNINKTYGSDAQSQIMAWKELSGLNYSGAIELYNMSKSSMTEDEITKKINSMNASTDFKTDTAKQQDLLNQIKENTAKTTAVNFEEKLNLLNRTVADILNAVNPTTSTAFPEVRSTTEILEAQNIPAAQSIKDLFANDIDSLQSAYRENSGRNFSVDAVYSDLQEVVNKVNAGKTLDKAALETNGTLYDYLRENTEIRETLEAYIQAMKDNTAATERNTNSSVVVQM